MDFYGFDGEFRAFQTVFLIFFVAVAGLILFTVLKSLFHWGKNRSAPVLTVDALVLSKRQETFGGAGDSPASTRYFATFEVQSGDRMELSVPDDQIGYLAEGDYGKLTFQGTQFQSFARN